MIANINSISYRTLRARFLPSPRKSCESFPFRREQFFQPRIKILSEKKRYLREMFRNFTGVVVSSIGVRCKHQDLAENKEAKNLRCSVVCFETSDTTSSYQAFFPPQIDFCKLEITHQPSQTNLFEQGIICQ